MSDPKEFLKSVIRYIHNEISEDALNYFLDGTHEKKLDKNENFININKPHSEIGFIAKGLFRGYYIDDKGREINTRFLKEGNFVTHYKAFILQQPSSYYFKAIEPSTVLCFNYTHIQKGYQLYSDLEKFGRLMAEEIIKKLESRLESQHFDNAEKRYYDFMKEYPDLHNRLSLEHISSYIRITRPALSRLRSKIS